MIYLGECAEIATYLAMTAPRFRLYLFQYLSSRAQSRDKNEKRISPQPVRRGGSLSQYDIIKNLSNYLKKCKFTK